jgi:hypothetical protein
VLHAGGNRRRGTSQLQRGFQRTNEDKGGDAFLGGPRGTALGCTRPLQQYISGIKEPKEG